MRITTFAAAAAVLAFAHGALAATIDVRPGPGTPLQDAFDQAANGDTIVIAKGTYRETATLSDRSDITIVGRGRAIVDGGGEDYVLTFENVDGLTVTGLTVRNAGNDCIATIDCAQVLISRCRLEDAGDSGLEDENSNGLTIERCSISRVDWGIAVSWNDEAGTQGIRIVKNRIRDVNDVGIEFSGDGAVIEKNVLTAIRGEGIKVDDSGPWTGATIVKNKISSHASGSGAGIVLFGSDHTIVKNKLAKTRGHGIDVSGDGGNTLEKNTVLRAEDAGVYLDSTGNTLTKNRALKSGTADLQSTVLESENTFDKNRFPVEDFPPDA